MSRASGWIVCLWHVLVLLGLTYAIGVLRPSRILFLEPSAWRPVNAWLRVGYFFRFATGRAAVIFFLVALVAGFLVLVAYLLNRRMGWMVMLAWNLLGAVNYFPRLVRADHQVLAVRLCLAFLVASVLTVMSRPRD